MNKGLVLNSWYNGDRMLSNNYEFNKFMTL